MRMCARRVIVAALGLAVSGGCLLPPPPPPTTVELVNNTTLDVKPEFYTSSSAADAEGLFVAAKRRTDFTDRPFPELRGGETVTLTFECDEIQSLGVDAPVLFDAVTLTVTTSADRIFLQPGTDFECGATVRLVYFTQGDAFRVRAEFP